ncbi:hypothetical protein N0V90_002008 [Kalmusia sp. IMI 367209]|nr:hypothetical protein N0V90_002008 [Kalmusia sp. IMI 367209]
MAATESMNGAHAGTSLRTPLELVIKTITTHAFALASYAYVSALLRRPTKSHAQAFRCLFFLFVPTLVLVELLVTVSQSLLRFLRNYEDDEDDLHFKFYLSAALGMHARLHKTDEEGSKDVKNKNVQLLRVGSHCAEKEVVPLSWAWAGKVLTALFSLTQAVGTIVMWARRLSTWEASAFSFDHRNGAMGIASAICGTICILTLLLRLNWKVSKAFETPQKESGYIGITSPRNQLIVEALMAMLLHLAIAAAVNEDNIWLYSSVGSIAFLVVGGHRVALGWQSLILVIFFYIFRHDIARKLGLGQDRYVRLFGGKRMSRLRALLGFFLVLWLATDIVWLFVADVLQVVRRRGESGNTFGYVGYWWQDPLSDSLIVI